MHESHAFQLVGGSGGGRGWKRYNVCVDGNLKVRQFNSVASTLVDDGDSGPSRLTTRDSGDGALDVRVVDGTCGSVGGG